ncbi:hypothetical protein CDES_03490 [Corynebacterium deserti GIMN1.010]|uniref:Uncharacterized protein n=1 Tax=Corynebacterium deserti GIMN1.010 TaxID=931089 RepID=A0A0M4CI76_9CORY|nr:hypothetical protein [Corynebacterium deserti]ALC05151.1 hypothetical protein CDES_03490 [Corynebacterium deserti GIMN1.010]
MRINLTTARTLAHELCALHHSPVPNLPSSDGHYDIHSSIVTTLDTYARNLALIVGTAESMGASALHHLDEIERTEDHFAHCLEKLT